MSSKEKENKLLPSSKPKDRTLKTNKDKKEPSSKSKISVKQLDENKKPQKIGTKEHLKPYKNKKDFKNVQTKRKSEIENIESMLEKLLFKHYNVINRNKKNRKISTYISKYNDVSKEVTLKKI